MNRMINHSVSNNYFLLLCPKANLKPYNRLSASDGAMERQMIRLESWEGALIVGK